MGQDFWKKNIHFFGLRSLYHEQAIRKQLVLPLEKYSKTLKDMIIGTGGTWQFESFTIFQSGQNNGVEIWASDGIPGAYPIKLPLILIL